MNELLVALALTGSILTGFALVGVLLGGLNRRNALFALALAAPVGIAIHSVTFFLYSMMLYPGSGFGFYVLVEAVLLLAALVWLRKGRPAIPSPEVIEGVPSSRLLYFLLAALLIALLLSIGRYLTEVMLYPHGRWDAWTIWILRARFMFLGQANWRDAFSPLISGGPDYPLLLSLAIARLWFYAERTSLLVPVIIGALFTYGTIALVGSALYRLNLPAQGILAAFTLACSPQLVSGGASQYADVPLGFFVAAAVILYYMYRRSTEDGRPGPAALIGVLVGAAAWTKNEGLAFLFCFLFIWTIFEVVVRSSRRPGLVRSSIALAAGLLPFLLCLLIFRFELAKDNPIVSGRTLEELIRLLTSPARYPAIAGAMLARVLSVGGWKVGVFPVLLILAMVLGLRKTARAERIAAISGFFILLGMLASYFLVYLTSPYSLQWHLAYSLTRLMSHLFPAFVFLAFTLIRTPFDPKPMAAHASVP